MSYNLFHERQERRTKQNKKQRRTLIIGGLMMLIAFCTIYTLILPALTMQEDIWCGKEVHLHEETCYQANLICTEPEETEGHVHIEECYEQVQVCTLEEHEHEEACYVDPNAESGDQIDTEDGQNVEPADDEENQVSEDEVAESEEPEEVDEEETSQSATEDADAEVEEEIFEEQAQVLYASTLSAGKYGKFKLSYNETKDAFTKDSAYAKYYNEDSPLGVAGSFHLVAFDTLTLNTHTNGNVLAHTLKANSNFGTKNYPDELSYVLNYQRVSSTSASKDKHLLVVGSNNQFTINGGNKEILYLNGVKVDSPLNLLQDTDSSKTPFIDLTNINIEAASISSRLASAKNQGVSTSFGDQNNRSIRLNDPNSVGVFTITANELNKYCYNPMKITGFSKNCNGTLIINVDCTDISAVTLPTATVFIDGVEQSTNEVTEFSNGKVIWNFVNASGVDIYTNRMTGMVIALGANVSIEQNLNGTVIAENITVKAESHRTDFTGHIELLRDSGIAIRKVDRDNIGIYLEGAEFKLVKWNGSQYETVAENLTTDENGLLVIQNIQYNTAYQLIETKAPTGYMLDDTVYSYFVPHSNTSLYPVKKPAGFTGSEHKEQEIKNIKNEKADVVSISVNKEWYIDKTKVTWIDGMVTVDLYQKVFSDSDRTKEIASLSNRVYAEDIQIDSKNGWKVTIENLPRAATETVNGTKTKVYYSYYVKEDAVKGFTPSYENNNGIISGNITVINSSDSFEEPKTTEIKINKKWFNFDEEEIVAPEHSSVTVQLYQTGYEDPLFHHQYGETISYGPPIELNDDNHWTYTVTGLPEYELVETKDGPQVIYYTYTIKEKAIGGYQDTYVNNDIYHGTITVKNTEKHHPTKIIVKKFWQDSKGNDEDKDGFIMVDVYQKVYGYIDEDTYDEDDYHGAKLYRKDVKISSEDGWTATIEGLPLHGWMLIDGQRVRVSYTYYVQEKEVEGYKSVYENNQGIVEGTITITNKAYSTYSLPETGGTGTTHFVVFGTLLMMLSVCGYFLYNKRFYRKERMGQK